MTGADTLVLSLLLRRAQAATDHYQVLLDEGAEVPGSPAEARLVQLIRDSGQVRNLWAPRVTTDPRRLESLPGMLPCSELARPWPLL